MDRGGAAAGGEMEALVGGAGRRKERGTGALLRKALPDCRPTEAGDGVGRMGGENRAATGEKEPPPPPPPCSGIEPCSSCRAAALPPAGPSRKGDMGETAKLAVEGNALDMSDDSS